LAPSHLSALGGMRERGGRIARDRSWSIVSSRLPCEGPERKLAGVFAPERHKLIVEYLRLHHSATLRELAAVTGSSEVTARRDLRSLQADGRLRRRHGGAVLQASPAHEPPYAAKARVAAAEKAAIAEAAAALVEAIGERDVH